MRFGLSGMSNPIQAGIDAYTSISKEFREDDAMELRKQEAADARERHSLERQRLQNQVDEQEADKPVKEMRREHELLQPHIASALTKMQNAAQNNTMPEFSTDEHGAIQKLQKDSPYLFDDPQQMFEQVHAVNGLLQAYPQLTQALQGHAKQTGQGKFIITEQNAPGVVSNFNKAFGKTFGGEAPELYIDLQGGTITPAKYSGADQGPPQIQPLTDKDGNVSAIPISELQNFTTKMQQFGTLALASYAQIGGDPKRQKEVEAAIHDHTTRGQVADALDDFSTWLKKDGSRAKVNERRTKLQGMLVKAGMDEKQAIATAKEQIQEKEPKYQKATSGTSDVILKQGEDGELEEVWKGDPQPKKEVDTETAALRRDLLRSQVDDKKSRQADKREAANEKRRDKLINENMQRLAGSPDGRDMSYDERRSEAERVADLQIAGKPTARPKDPAKEQEKRLEPLKQQFGKADTKGILGTGFRSTDTKSLIDDAAKKGWTEQEIRQAAVGTPMEDAVDNYSFQQPKKAAERTPLAKSAAPKQTAQMPPASKNKGKFLRDTDTGKRYRSDGSNWVEVKRDET